jgi:hypothetical protein
MIAIADYEAIRLEAMLRIIHRAAMPARAAGSFFQIKNAALVDILAESIGQSAARDSLDPRGACAVRELGRHGLLPMCERRGCRACAISPRLNRVTWPQSSRQRLVAVIMAIIAVMARLGTVMASATTAREGCPA